MSLYTVSYTENKQLTKHINTQELRCKCGCRYEIKIDTELLYKVENMLDIIGKANGTDDVHIYISSANRCKTHDKNVGGSGYGMHTLGKAIDFAVTANGKYIDTKDIACICQELGFNGIGRINDKYIHADVGVRNNGKWLGDETVSGGTSDSVIYEPNTYWNYYNINKDKYFKPENLSIEKRIQQYLGVTVDGIVGQATIAAMKKHSLNKEYVKLIQELLNSKNYNCGTIDGVIGEATIKAMLSASIDKMFG